MLEKNRTYSVLETDLSSVEESQRLWLEQRNKKINIYRELEESIHVLENTKKKTTNPYNKWKLDLAIKRLKRKQKKYEVDPILSFNFDKKEENTLEKSSSILVKKFQEKHKL